MGVFIALDFIMHVDFNRLRRGGNPIIKNLVVIEGIVRDPGKPLGLKGHIFQLLIRPLIEVGQPDCDFVCAGRDIFNKNLIIKFEGPGLGPNLKHCGVRHTSSQQQTGKKSQK